MKILLLVNESASLYLMRKEIVDELLNKKCEVYFSCNKAQHFDEVINMGCKYIPCEVARQSKNPLNDIKLLKNYHSIIKKLKPDAVLTFAIKPNIYGGLACKRLHVKYIANICGLGTALEYDNPLKPILIKMYKVALNKASCVFFQNSENVNFFKKNKMLSTRYKLLPGSGVNLSRYPYIEYPEDKEINFYYMSRIKKEKGIELYYNAAKVIHKKYNNTKFHAMGYCEDSKYLKLFENKDTKDFFIYHGEQKNIMPFMTNNSCTICPTYYPEGMSNTLLESASCGRPLIATDRPGCKEIIDDNINGFLCKPNDEEDLINKIEKFINLPLKDKIEMGKAGRKKVEKEFDRQIVVNAYIKELGLD